MSIRLGKPVNRIRELRIAEGWTAADIAGKIAEATGDSVSGSAILKIERGAMDLNDTWRQRFSTVFGCEQGELETNADDGIPVLDEEELTVGQRFEGRDAEREHLSRAGYGGGVLVAFMAREVDAADVEGVIPGYYVIFKPGQGQTGWPLKVVRTFTDGGYRARLTDEPRERDTVLGDIIDVRRPVDSKTAWKVFKQASEREKRAAEE